MKAPGGTIGAIHLIIKTLFYETFSPIFSTQNLDEGLMNYACSIKLLEFYFQHLSFVFKIQVLCALRSGFQVSHFVALG